MSKINNMEEDISRIIISYEEIQNRIKELGLEISNTYEPEDDIILVGATENYEARCRSCHEVKGKPKGDINE
jgi:hypothetical protein